VEFKVSVLKYSGSTDWIEEALKEIKELLDGDIVPGINLECAYCSYNESVDEVLKRR
jgi:CRISPR/Cas system-associated exonuclease Cas4 (RecB family)